MRRPLVGGVLAFIAGTWLGLNVPVGTDILLFVFLVSLSVSLMGRIVRSPLFLFFLCVSMLFGGWLSASSRENDVGDSFLIDFMGERIEVVGVVAGDPSVRLSLDKRSMEWRFPVDVSRVRKTNGVWRNVKSRLDVSWRVYGVVHRRNGSTPPVYGQEWNFCGYMNSYYWIAGSNNYFLRSNAGNSECLSSGHRLGLVGACYSARHRASSLLSIGLDSYGDIVGLFRAMLLGYRESMTQDAQLLFRATGTIHVFAISGLHVGIFAMFIIFVLRSLRISRVHWILFLAPLLIAYTLATGARASAVRACIMAVTCFLAPLVGRRTDVSCALAFAAFLILLVSPRQLFDVGFIYSFVVVFWLIVLYPKFDLIFSRFWQKDSMQLQDDVKWILVLRKVGRYVCSLVALSFAAWLASAPLTAYFFGRFVPVALLCNILVIPLAFLIVLSGCLSLVLGSCLLFMADVFNHAALAVISLLVWVMKIMTIVPYGSMDIPRPPLWSVLLWYMLLGFGTLMMVQRGWGNRDAGQASRRERGDWKLLNEESRVGRGVSPSRSGLFTG